MAWSTEYITILRANAEAWSAVKGNIDEKKELLKKVVSDITKHHGDTNSEDMLPNDLKKVRSCLNFSSTIQTYFRKSSFGSKTTASPNPQGIPRTFLA
jgi:hypothetical protein